ncbi:MAG: hypothetical protein H6728_17975 [Myxococcales bacterium]|nr:hypothetical protein [Myxococcales bacterium]
MIHHPTHPHLLETHVNHLTQEKLARARRVGLWRLLGARLLMLLALFVWASAACTGPQTNPQACGGCPQGSECVLDKFCLTLCPAGTTRCDFDCTNLQSDFLHCGACGQACKSGEACVNGACQVSASSCVPLCQGGKLCAPNGLCVCAAGETDCGGACFSLNASPLHCGACNNKCPSGSACENGTCTCLAGQSLCGGVCTQTQKNDLHCGACNNKCPQDRFCDQGACSCRDGKIDCNGACVDLLSDAANCGACGTACLPNQACKNGSCFCPRDETICNGSCVNLRTTDANCGICGNACAQDQACINGSCVQAQKCANGQLKCAGLCVDPNTDRGHCGACYTICPEGQDCASGSCQVLTCQTGEVKCNGRCADLLTNSAFCGSCNNPCNSYERCVQGQCAPVCQTGQALCGTTCADTQTDRQHCGACGNACPTSSKCEAGACVSYCTAGLLACGNDGCVDPMINTKHCGGCNTDCDVCENGVCQCSVGRINCGNQCASLQTDARHCGACGMACPAQESCVAGACKRVFADYYPDADGDGFGDKNAMPVNANTQNPPAGMVTNNLDCCDQDKDANPNQTGFFGVANKCGSFDYNCDGKETPTAPICQCTKSIDAQSDVKYSFSTRDTSNPNYSVVHDIFMTATPLKITSADGTCNAPKSTVRFAAPPATKTVGNFMVVAWDMTCGSCTQERGADVLGLTSFTETFQSSDGANYVMWDTSSYSQGCAFFLSGARPVCGSKNVSKAPSLLNEIYNYNNTPRIRTEYNVYVSSSCCRSFELFSSVYLRGKYNIKSNFGVSVQPTETIATLECQ